MLVSTRDIRDAHVRNTAGEDLGAIESLVLDAVSGQVIYAVLGYGGILGYGEKLFAIPWEAITLRPEEREVIIDAARERLESDPGFDRNQWPRQGDWTLITGPHATAPRREEELRRPLEPARPATTETYIPPREREIAASQPAEVTLVAATEPRGTMRPAAEERVAATEEMPAARPEIMQERVTAAEEHLSAADLQDALRGLDYPARKQDLIGRARGNDAPSSVIEVLGQFEDREYHSAADVSREFGRIR
ncbi:MAG: DUF2795 domain-containing protein [Methanomicrobiales archaeon]|nr:DUF2795 domain-containing protein [Methanomicrobiales archaeon]